MRRWLARLLLLLLAGCAAVPTYTSQDLAILPCETDIPRFFQPLEFNLDGTVLFADQQAGWNKTAYVAEREYQDFLCRFHTRLREAEGPAAVESDRLLIIGVFWRSTLASNSPDPLLAKWITYFPVRERADLLARTGFTDMMRDLTDVLGERRPDKAKPKLHLGTPAHDLMRRVDRLNMVLLNAAVGPEDFKPIEAFALREPVDQKERGELLSAVQAQAGGKVSAATTTKIYAGYTFNVYSGHDLANRWLFPIGALLTDDEAQALSPSTLTRVLHCVHVPSIADNGIRRGGVPMTR